MKLFNFEENFIKWIHILYTDIQACVGNNGRYSNYFKLTRSVRQGCPISALLFIMVAEIIALKIRNNDEVSGVKVDEAEFKINMMADDTTIYLSNLLSLEKVIEDFQKFEKISGLKLNLNKTELIPINVTRNRQIEMVGNLSKIRVKTGPFKALGIWFSKNEEEIQNLNLTDRTKRIESLINMWKPRKLSLKGKIVIIKTLLLPQIQFLFSMIQIPDNILKKIDSLLFDYLWEDKPAKVKRTTIISKVEQGGLGMIDVYEVHNAAKTGWIKRLLNESNSKLESVNVETIGDIASHIK